MWFRWTVSFLIIFRICLFVYFIAADGTYIHLDSGAYIDLAENFLRNHVFALSTPHPDFELQSPDRPYGPEVFRTPGYPAFLALLSFLGMKHLLWAVFFQEIIYGLAVFIFYYYGRQFFSATTVRIGVIFLMVNLGGIAYPKLILSEILFMPFAFGCLFSVGLYLKYSNWRYLLAAGVIMGIGVLIRPAIFYFPWIAAGTIILFTSRNKQRWLHVGVMLLTFALVISPWLIRNYQTFGQYFISGQTSNMLAHYHVPRVWNAKGIKSYWQGRTHIREMIAEARSIQEKELGRPLDGVEFFKFQQNIALAELVKYPKTYITQWISGALKAMYVPFSVEIYNVFHKPGAKIPFPELFADTLQGEKTDLLGIPLTASSGVLYKFIYFLVHADKLYLFTIATTVLTMIFAFMGVFYIFEKKDRFLWLIMLANFYFICIAGPMGYARFRFPIEVFWFIQAWFGVIWFWGFCQQNFKKLKLIRQPAA